MSHMAPPKRPLAPHKPAQSARPSLHATGYTRPMAILCDLPQGDLEGLTAVIAPLANALALPILGTTTFDAALAADPADPRAVAAAMAEAAAAFDALIPLGVSSIGLAPRLNGEPAWAPPVRRAIEHEARLLAVDARGPAGAAIGDIVRASPVPVVVAGHRVAPPPATSRIIVLGDGSPESLAIGPALSALLAGTRVQVDLLAISIPVLGERTEDHELELARGLEALEAAMPGVAVATRRVEPARSFESVAAAAHRVAVATEAACIALATHGRGRALRFLLGSVADSLVRTSSVPLLLVRSTAPAP